jgi:hypothetical protein
MQPTLLLFGADAPPNLPENSGAYPFGAKLQSTSEID